MDNCNSNKYNSCVYVVQVLTFFSLSRELYLIEDGHRCLSVLTMKSGCILLSNLGVGLLDEDEYSK
jgi:hypothetical protein